MMIIFTFYAQLILRPISIDQNERWNSLWDKIFTYFREHQVHDFLIC